MKVFISWSGEFSKRVAERLSTWIQIIIQTVDVFYSPDDIEKGENWGNRLTQELEQSNFGIVCLTPENITAPWIHFEAGALSKATNSRVSAVMLGITPSDVKGPLARLQNTAFNREDFYRLFQSINESSDTPLKPHVLQNAFDNSWDRLMGDISTIIKNYSSRPSPPDLKEHDSNSEALQELLRLVRNLDSTQKVPAVPVFPKYHSDLDDFLAWVSKLKQSDLCSVLVTCSKHCISATRTTVSQYALPKFGRGVGQIENDLITRGYCIVNVPSDKLFPLFEALCDLDAEMGLRLHY